LKFAEEEGFHLRHGKLVSRSFLSERLHFVDFRGINATQEFYQVIYSIQAEDEK